MSLDLSKIKKAYFIGIGGFGISALAQMMQSLGVEVSGIDDGEWDTVKMLKEKGISVTMLSDFEKIPEADLYIYSDAWLYRGPEVINQAKATGKNVLSFFEALGLISKNYQVIAISGTHGKTTTTAMVGEMLVASGLDPTVLLGSIVKSFNSNFRPGKGEYLVVEADEYNKHMLNFHPFIGAITNMEPDHLDVYKDFNDIKSAFQQFLEQSEYKIDDYVKYVGKVPKLKVPGEHNRMNAAVALAIADVLNIDEEVAKKALADFEGTGRRLEKIGETKEGVIIYDDYAHHPTEIRASLEALQDLYKSQRIIVVFQPHMYSRTKALFEDFVKELSKAKELYLLPIFYAREAKDESVSSDVLCEEINKIGGNAKSFPDFESAESYLRGKEWGKGDVFVTMGAGEAYKVADVIFDF